MYHAHPLSPSRSVRVAACALLLLICSVSTAFSSSAPPDRVTNGDIPDHGIETVVLEERWRRGSEDDDLFFGLIIAALADDDGKVYLLDAQLNEVIVLDRDGGLVSTLGRKGEGPGEFSNVGALTWMPDATLGVVQRFPGRIVKLALDGTPAGNVLPADPVGGGRDILNGARVSGDVLILCGAHLTRDGDTQLRRWFLSSYDENATPVVNYLASDVVFASTDRRVREIDSDFVGNGRWDVLRDGGVVAAPQRDRYALMLYGPDGTPLLEITRPAEPPQRPQDKLDEMEARYKASGRYTRMGIEQEFSPYNPMIQRIDARDNGEIWILPTEGTRPQTEGVFQVWDVFTETGTWDRQVAISGPGDSERDQLFLMNDGRALLVSGFQNALDAMRGQSSDDESNTDDAEPMEVILYEIR